MLPRRAGAVTNFAAIINAQEKWHDCQLLSPSSWSCAHGIERWRSNCGCNSGSNAQWNQEWRAPLRSALESLKGKLDALYEKEAAGMLSDPWAARDAYVAAVDCIFAALLLSSCSLASTSAI